MNWGQLFFKLFIICDCFKEYYGGGVDGEPQIQAPRVITQPSAAGSGLVSEGRTKILQCQALGLPQPEYRWLKDGIYLGPFSSEHFYKIQSSKRDDSGDYQCVMRNDAGAIFSDKIRVTVAYMGLFEGTAEDEKTVVVQAGEAAVLELPPIKSVPLPSVSWQAGDNSLLYGAKYATTTDFRQVILDVNSADQKSYRARATNTQLGQDELSNFIQLIVMNPSDRNGRIQDQIPPSIIIPPLDTQIIKGQSESELQCIANGRPLHELETLWLKDGISIESAGIQFSFNDLYNRTLSLLRVSNSHGGEYTCQTRLRNSQFPVQSSSAKISIIEKPSFQNLLPPETFGEFGREISLRCSVTGIPKPNITWYKDTVRVDGLPGLSIDHESATMTIQFLRGQDSGIYQCWASNTAGEANSYTWLRVKKDKERYHRLKSISSPTTGSLNQARIAKLTVYDIHQARPGNATAPIMMKGPENKTVLEGNDVTVYCEVGGAPYPNVTWYKNETEEICSGGRFQILETGSLLIAGLRSRDAGQYSCIRSNSAGTVIGSAFVSALVRTQIIQPPVDTQVILGQFASLQCKVSSDPTIPFQIQWEHNNEPIIFGASPRFRMQLDGTLEIQEVRATDVGSYKCKDGGHDERTAQLKIIELPYPPTNIKATILPKLGLGASSRAINLTWSSGFDGNSPLVKFIVQRRIVIPEGREGETIDYVPASWETLMTNVSAEVRHVVIESLKPAASYQFRISGVNAVGEGEPSSPSNVISLPQEAPSGPPIGLVGSARSPSEIIIQWHPPPEEHRNGELLGYVLRYRLHGYGDIPWSFRNISNEAQRNYLIQDLITWKDYEIQLAAYNNKGVGIYSASIKVKTREGIPNAPPSNVRAEPVNSTCIKIYWKPPDPQQINGINQGYRIEAWEGATVKRSIDVPPSPFDPLAEQVGVICNLDKFTSYNITVLCFTNPGDGKRSVGVMTMTFEDVPDEVSNLHFEEISDRAVRVVWSHPTKPNGILTGYNLRYGIKDIAISFQNMNLTGDVTNIKVTHLKASTYYTFEVCGVTSVGRGVCRSASMKSGVEPVLPSPPLNLAVSNIQPTSVVLQFTPGFDGNSSITTWSVKAQTNRNASWVEVYEYFEETEGKQSNTIAPSSTESIVVMNLLPFTQYRLILIANNVVGPSIPSFPTQQFQTLQASPAHPPRNVTVRPMSATQLKVRWIPLQQLDWNGNPRGYNISYRVAGSSVNFTSETVNNPTANAYILDNFEEYTQYELLMYALNDVGVSEPSAISVERTREAVPAVGPQILEGNSTSSTTIVVRWAAVPEMDANGVIEGYKVYYGAKTVSFQYKLIPSNTTFKTTLTELKKFTKYNIQILAYTRMGDGFLSNPPAVVQTWDDVPGPVSNVTFPDVSTSMARMIWDPPADPNGVILAYKITYALEGFTSASFSMDFPPDSRTYRATDLDREKNYWFSISAKTRLGWGESARLLVFTTINRELPQAPSSPRISPSQIQSRQITFSWTPGRDGFAPIRYYTLQFREGDTYWQNYAERVTPAATSYSVKSLKPYTDYRFRIQATNDIGSSGWSPESNITRTLTAAPTGKVSDIQVVPITVTSVRVTWKPIPLSMWNGDAESGGYRVEYRPTLDYNFQSLQSTPKEEVRGAESAITVLRELTRDKNYEVWVIPFNSRGDGEPSRPVTVYVGEAVPTGEPRDVVIKALSSTEIYISWKAPPQKEQNGDLLGYKLYYQSEGMEDEELEVVPPWTEKHSLFFLEMYTWYSIRIAAFNPAGDGPFTSPSRVRTHQGPPGPVSNITFFDITMTNLRVKWTKPLKPNGEIAQYFVSYETLLEGGLHEDDQVISRQVRQRVMCCSLFVDNLEEETRYTFSVKARNEVLGEVGPAEWSNISTGPQAGSPAFPTDLRLTKMYAAVLMTWTNDKKSEILGYYIEAKRHDENRWQTIHKTSDGPLTSFTVSFTNLLPSTAYKFRLIGYNQYGISYPVASDEVVFTPSKLYLEYGYHQQSSFYKQTWFLVVTASVSVIIIIGLIAYLCVITKTYQYKHDSERSLDETTSIEEGILYGSSVELRQSQKKISTLKRKGIPASKPPPRPTPGSVTYTDDESDKAYDNNPDESSLTEKPSEISSSDSQESETEGEDEVDTGGVTVPHSFVNHYANVNDTLKQSWQKQKPVRGGLPVNYSSYTDSEPEATASLQGAQGRVILENQARSRKPLPGFSSFI